MSAKRRKHIVVIGILLIASVFIFKIEQAKGGITSDINFDKIPFKLSGWEGQDLKLSEDVYEILETRDVLTRRYKDKDGDILELSIVYSGKDRQTFHPPEVCFIGGGIEIENKTKESVLLENNKPLELTRLDLTSPQGTIKSWYWFLVGDRFVSSFYKQQLYFISDALRGEELKGALIKVSIRGDSESLEKKAKFFISEIAPYLAKTF